MKATPQHEFHPGAESLNAFAEQALGTAERAEVLAHLAACSRCRAIVHLAQDAAEAALPAIASLPAPRPWYRGWQIAWIPAGALAVVAGLSVFAYLHHEKPTPEIAQVAAHPAVPPRPARTPVVAAAATAKIPAAPATAMHFAPRNRTVAPEPIQAEAMPGTAASGAFSSTAVSRQPFEMASADNLPVNNLRQVTAAATAQAGQARNAWAQQQHIDRAAPKEALVTGIPPQPQAMQLSRRAAARDVEPPAMAAVRPTPAPIEEPLEPRARMTAMAPRIVANTRLPSGLAMLERASSDTATLALDVAGNLFLSSDQGATWTRVPRQWSGRIVTVRVRPSAPATAGPAHVFEIVNAQNRIWSSTDGQTWTAE